MIRKIFSFSALFLCLAAGIAVLADCAKTVALAELSFTPFADFLALFGLSPATALRSSRFFWKAAYSLPVWPVFLLPVPLFYQLSHWRVFLWEHRRHKAASRLRVLALLKPHAAPHRNAPEI